LTAVAFALTNLTLVARATCTTAVTAVLTGRTAPYTIGITGVHHIAIADGIIDLVILAVIGQKFTMAIGYTCTHIAAITIDTLSFICPLITNTGLTTNLGVSTSALLSIWHTLIAMTRAITTKRTSDTSIPIVACSRCHTSLRKIVGTTLAAQDTGITIAIATAIGTV
jgi:hypothetical protein